MVSRTIVFVFLTVHVHIVFVCLFCTVDVAHTYTEPLILRLNGTPQRLQADDGDNCNSNTPHLEPTTPSKSITCE